jgi:hypothetical protein
MMLVTRSHKWLLMLVVDFLFALAFSCVGLEQLGFRETEPVVQTLSYKKFTNRCILF